MATTRGKQSDKASSASLEERLEYQNVTEFRRSMLGIFHRMEENSDLRFIVTRGGKPCAVVLSYEAYELLRRIARRAADATAAKDRDQRLDEAFLQMAQKEAAEAGIPLFEPLLDENYLQTIIKRSILEGVKHELRRRCVKPKGNLTSADELSAALDPQKDLETSG